MTTDTSATRFPPPHRAPGLLEELATAPFDGGSTPDEPAGRRYQRPLEGGWLAARIRKQSRHWRQR